MLAIAFEDLEAFSKEYHENLTKGGLFVPTSLRIELRTRIEVGIELRFCRQSIVLEGDVVHCVPPELASAGAVPGVAVQFDLPPGQLRGIFEKLVGSIPAPAGHQTEEESAKSLDRRAAPRETVRVGARVCNTQGERLEGMTRNLSSTGLLFSVAGDSLPIGERVIVTLTNSNSGETLEIPSEVAREVQGEAGDVPALGIHFSPDENSRAKTKAFLRRLRDDEHTRRLGGIKGEIKDMGLASLLQSLGLSSQEGTVTVINGNQEGYIAFSQGSLVATRVGRVTGPKALVRLLAWTQGRFEFYARIDSQIVRDPPVHLEAAVLDAVREIDESRRDRAVLSDQEMSFELAPVAVHGLAGDLGKIECAIVDLVRVGANVRRLLDVIPEPDMLIHEALAELIGQEILIPKTPES